MRTIFVALRALAVVGLLVLLWWWVALGVRNLDQQFGLALPARAAPAGVIAVLAGAILVLVSVAAFVLRGQGTPAPFDPPRRFVAVGPYRYLRNPMYVSVVTALVGFGLGQRSPSIVIFAFVWLAGAHLFVVCFEEPNLRTKFTAAYQNYCKAVPRWLPRRNAWQSEDQT
jgi:protein-S-isoprenylcysteine O-methyltransferase Ste14